MKRKIRLTLCLLLAAMILSACSNSPSNEQVFPEMTQALGPVTVTDTPAPQVGDPSVGDDSGLSDDPSGQSIFDMNPYLSDFSDEDPLKEENYVDPYGEEDLTAPLYASEPEETVYPYAGSTPIPLDPLDMPTPTPRPALSFTYSAYSPSSIGVTFEGPVGWMVDESQAQIFTLSEPDAQIKDGQQCIITISAEPVTSNYSESDLKSQVTQRLDYLSTSEFVDWKPSYTATRYMMGSLGVYANYTGTLVDGVEVGGRILYVCIDRVLYGLEIIFPVGFKEDYLDVFNQIRSTMKLVN